MCVCVDKTLTPDVDRAVLRCRGQGVPITFQGDVMYVIRMTTHA